MSAMDRNRLLHLRETVQGCLTAYAMAYRLDSPEAVTAKAVLGLIDEMLGDSQ